MFFDPFEEEHGGERDPQLQQSIQSISTETLQQFILLAVLVQVGLFAISIGLLLVGFRGELVLGGALACVGVVALVVAVVVYRRRGD
ncbi:DUF7322 domain-containing protein [Halorussus halophilus]|uniref:DUF7322 domain-containing protein n=1 Tax=Halorussus halophilus TaxID=2650975 RepID=UPI0013016981|nr:hypothetical protein [Halorussus halophilus]